jgi:hypothetical protein
VGGLQANTLNQANLSLACPNPMSVVVGACIAAIIYFGAAGFICPAVLQLTRLLAYPPCWGVVESGNKCSAKKSGGLARVIKWWAGHVYVYVYM